MEHEGNPRLTSTCRISPLRYAECQCVFGIGSIQHTRMGFRCHEDVVLPSEALGRRGDIADEQP